MGLRTALGIKKGPSIAPDVSEMFAGKDFTSDWTSFMVPSWQKALAHLRDRPAKILEIGSFEGRSAVAFLTILPNARITCVDPFNMEQHRRFDHNVAEFGTRVRKLRGVSAAVLPNLVVEQETFDVIYIDGDHTRSGTLIDTLLCWPLLKRGGLLIWDDYLWKVLPEAENRPKQAIDWFLKEKGADLQILHKDYQVIAKRVR